MYNVVILADASNTMTKLFIFNTIELKHETSSLFFFVLSRIKFEDFEKRDKLVERERERDKTYHLSVMIK
jgi:hypothetical protein